MKYLRLAFSMLTVFPVGNMADQPQSGDSGRAAVWYPYVGLAIGVLAASGWCLSRLLFTTPLAAGLTLALWIGLTGGLHLDGLADCFDGLFTGSTRERRLEIMADPRLGSFGTIGVVLFLIIKTTALAVQPGSNIPFVILFACVLSRWIVLIGGKQPLAREGGMAADFSTGLSNRTIVIAAFLPAVLIILGGWQAALAAGMAVLATVGILALALNRIGGVTGDVFGLIIEVSELMVLLTYAAL